MGDLVPNLVVHGFRHQGIKDDLRGMQDKGSGKLRQKHNYEPYELHSRPEIVLTFKFHGLTYYFLFWIFLPPDITIPFEKHLVRNKAQVSLTGNLFLDQLEHTGCLGFFLMFCFQLS